MRPADLSTLKRQMPVGRIAIGADDRPGIGPQHLTDPVPSPAFANGEHRNALGHRRPQPGFGAVLPPACPVDVDDSLSANEGARLLDRTRQGGRYFLFQPADRTQRHLKAEGVGQQGPDALAHPVGPGQQADPGLHAGTEDVTRHALRVTRLRSGGRSDRTAECAADIRHPGRASEAERISGDAEGRGPWPLSRCPHRGHVLGLTGDQAVHLFDRYPRAPRRTGVGRHRGAGKRKRRIPTRRARRGCPLGRASSCSNSAMRAVCCSTICSSWSMRLRRPLS